MPVNVRIPCPNCHGAGELYFESRNHPGYAASNDCDRCDCNGELDWTGPTLAHNLAIGGALCRAFQLGGAYHIERYMTNWNGGGWSYPFEPGCGRSAP